MGETADLIPGTASIVRDAVISIENGPVLALWEPGSEKRLPPGAAFRLPPGSKIHLQIHCKKNFNQEQSAVSDKSTVGLYFTDPPGSGRELQSFTIDPPKAANRSRSQIVAVRPRLDRPYASLIIEAITPSRAARSAPRTARSMATVVSALLAAATCHAPQRQRNHSQRLAAVGRFRRTEGVGTISVLCRHLWLSRSVRQRRGVYDDLAAAGERDRLLQPIASKPLRPWTVQCQERHVHPCRRDSFDDSTTHTDDRALAGRRRLEQWLRFSPPFIGSMVSDCSSPARPADR